MHFPGDLLCNVLAVSPEYFRAHAQELDRVIAIMVRVPALARALGETDFACFSAALEEVVPGFQKLHPEN